MAWFWRTGPAGTGVGVGDERCQSTGTSTFSFRPEHSPFTPKGQEPVILIRSQCLASTDTPKGGEGSSFLLLPAWVSGRVEFTVFSQLAPQT